MPKPEQLDAVMTHIRSVRGLSVAVAKACGIDRQAVYQWTQVPTDRVHTVAKVIKMKPEKIRPDIFKYKR